MEFNKHMMAEVERSVCFLRNINFSMSILIEYFQYIGGSSKISNKYSCRNYTELKNLPYAKEIKELVQLLEI